ncbi:MAG: hypothetical protein FD127_2271 [Acidimicrobiaceae bacterium]|nr:MAG: hypothetical protein FD127_2271 [Acidimicrobiaceae bacterium]
MPVDVSALAPAFARLVGAAVTDDVADRERDQVEVLLADAARVQGLVEAVRLAATNRLQVLADSTGLLDPEQILGQLGRTSRRDVSQTIRRAHATNAIPQLATALADGDVSVTHLDAVSNALTRLEPDQRDLLAAEGDWITTVASRSTPDELARALALRVRQLCVDDGIARFERQRRATTLRHWTDQITGMMCLYGEFDPETGARITAAIHATVEQLFHDTTPDTCPDDDRKQGHLRALAVARLLEGTPNGSPSRPTFVVVIDQQTLWNGLHATSRIEIAGDVELPVETLRRHACLADIIPVVLDGNGVAVDVGRSRRLATPAQRHALRAMYPRCAIHGCTVAFDNCEPHHILYWRHGGPSDLANLIPLCSKHHHLAHEGGWQLSLRPDDRLLTVTLPDGTTLANPPPHAKTLSADRPCPCAC